MNTINRQVAPLAEACMAKRSLRFWEYLIDGVILMVLEFFVGRVFSPISGANAASAAFTAALAQQDSATAIAMWPKMMGQGAITSNVMLVLYYFICEAFFHGKTIGKSACGLRTVTIDGSQPTTGAIALRSICRLIPFAVFSVLFGNYWRGGRIRGNWYDSLSKTYVIKDSLVKKYNELVKNTEFETRFSSRNSARNYYDRAETGTAAAPDASKPAQQTEATPETTFAEGDKVTFRYGSSEVMRVKEVSEDGMVTCWTYDENGNHADAGRFPAKYLDKVE